MNGYQKRQRKLPNMVATDRSTLNGRDQYIIRLKSCADHKYAGPKSHRQSSDGVFDITGLLRQESIRTRTNKLARGRTRPGNKRVQTYYSHGRRKPHASAVSRAPYIAQSMIREPRRWLLEHLASTSEAHLEGSSTADLFDLLQRPSTCRGPH